jgi:nucleoside-diphosphate-sugar epimerase
MSGADISVVVVTGASGFIGSHIVKACLERGFKVHGCVRNKDDPKNKFLLDMAQGLPGSIELFSADLVTEGAYDNACRDAQAVIHAAAQVDPTVIQDPWKDMVEPSTRGVANILNSVNRRCSQMVAFVHTSSIASVGFRENKVVTEADWSTVSIEESPYAFAKRKGEETMWEMTNGRSYRVSAINPTMASMREKNMA